jgi:hypothetical protein
LWLVLSLAFSRTAGLGSPAARAAFENVSVVQQPIQHGGDCGTITEQLSPVFNGSVRCNQGAGSLVSRRVPGSSQCTFVKTGLGMGKTVYKMVHFVERERRRVLSLSCRI